MLCFLAASAIASANTGYEVTWYTLGGGGGQMSSPGGLYEASCTIGQPDAGEMTGGSYTVTGGFWPGAVSPGDCDGDVDLNDFAGFDPAACLQGPDGGLGAGCACLNFDGDNDVDLRDFAAFQVAFTGP